MMNDVSTKLNAEETYEIPNDLIQFVNELHHNEPDICAKVLLGFADNNIQKAIECMKDGGVVLFFARLTYGFAASALSQKGIERIYEIKGRDYRNPLSLISNRRDIGKWAEIDKDIQEIVEALTGQWPGNVSIVLPKKADIHGNLLIPHFVTSGLSTVNLMCMDDIAEKLSMSASFPIAATSANKSGSKPIIDPIQGIREFAGDVDLLLLGPRSDIGVNSSIVDLVSKPARLLREGPAKFENLLNVIPNLTR